MILQCSWNSSMISLITQSYSYEFDNVIAFEEHVKAIMNLIYGFNSVIESITYHY